MNNLSIKIDIVVQVLRILGFKTIVHVLGNFWVLIFQLIMEVLIILLVLNFWKSCGGVGIMGFWHVYTFTKWNIKFENITSAKQTLWHCKLVLKIVIIQQTWKRWPTLAGVKRCWAFGFFKIAKMSGPLMSSHGDTMTLSLSIVELVILNKEKNYHCHSCHKNKFTTIEFWHCKQRLYDVSNTILQ
jgi:hypothetical protein